jgi:hypothetical protein
MPVNWDGVVLCIMFYVVPVKTYASICLQNTHKNIVNHKIVIPKSIYFQKHALIKI